MMKFLVQQKGANVNFEDSEKQTPIFYATEKKNLEMVKFLIAQGAKLEHRELLLRTPLYFAASCGAKEVLECLLA